MIWDCLPTKEMFFVCFILLLAPLWINSEIKRKINTTNDWEGLDKTTRFREIISQDKKILP